jgi:hypothetical protein
VNPFVFGSDGTDPEEDSGVLEPQDTLEDLGVGDVLDTGWSPAERPWAATDWGTTGREELAGESLAGRLAREIPEQQRESEGDGLGDVSGTDGELIDNEVGGARAGRLIETLESWGDVEPELYGVDVGIDSGAASAEEAAVHLVPEEADAISPGWTDR